MQKSSLVSAAVALFAMGLLVVPASADLRGSNAKQRDVLCRGGQIVGDCFFRRRDDFWDRWTEVTCDEARRNLANRGYTRIKTVSCKGQIYVFKGRWKGKTFELKVSRRTGDLRSARKI